MTDSEQTEINDWLASIRDKQPAAGTLALVVYVRNGLVVPDFSMMKEFPTLDIPAAREMIDEFLDERLESALNADAEEET